MDLHQLVSNISQFRLWAFSAQIHSLDGQSSQCTADRIYYRGRCDMLKALMGEFEALIGEPLLPDEG